MKFQSTLKTFLLGLASLTLTLGLNSCGTKIDREHSVLISVSDQEMLVTKKGKPVKAYPVSTSKFGLGSQFGSKKTPLGQLSIAKKIGDRAPSGSVFKNRRRTGEVIPPNAPGRDPVVTRILWLSGKDAGNRNTYGRYIYIHGTPEENRIGSPASYGCIRMKSKDVIDLYNSVGVGADVRIMQGSLSDTQEGRMHYARHGKPKHLRTAARW